MENKKIEIEQSIDNFKGEIDISLESKSIDFIAQREAIKKLEDLIGILPSNYCKWLYCPSLSIELINTIFNSNYDNIISLGSNFSTYFVIKAFGELSKINLQKQEYKLISFEDSEMRTEITREMIAFKFKSADEILIKPNLSEISIGDENYLYLYCEYN